MAVIFEPSPFCRVKSPEVFIVTPFEMDPLIKTSAPFVFVIVPPLPSNEPPIFRVMLPSPVFNAFVELSLTRPSV